MRDKSAQQKTTTLQLFSHLKLTAIVAFLFLAAVQTQAGIVTKTSDSNDGVCNSDCSLREAIATAPAGDTITFNSFFNSPRTINLTLGELLINKNLTITGTGARNLTVQRSTAAGTPEFRIFYITGSNNVVSISGLSIVNGKLANETGGGIAIASGNTLNLNEVTVKSNSASYGGGIGANGNLNILNSTISGNTVVNNGGGIRIDNGTTNISNTTISDNSAAGDGGGGIMNFTGTVLLTNVTVSNNTCTCASASGGGIRSIGTVRLRNSIVASNTAPAGPNITSSVVSLGKNLIGINDGAAANFPAGSPNANGDIVGTSAAPVNPQLGALQNNGGETDTRMLLPNSPAIDVGNNCVTSLNCPSNNPPAALTTDQRGTFFTRTYAGNSDIGAFETGISAVVNTNDTGGGSLRQVIADTLAGGMIFFKIPSSANGCDSSGECTVNLTSGEIVVNKDLHIIGANARASIVRRSAAAGTPNFRIFSINGSGTTLKLNTMTISGGNPAQNGGAILINSGASLEIYETAIINNTGSAGGAIMNFGGLIAVRSNISQNLGTNDSGAIRNNGTAMIVNSTLSNNTSLNNGGAIVDFGTLTLINTTFSGNTGNVGGGIFKAGGSALRLRNTIIAGNFSGNGDPRTDVGGTFTSAGNNLIGNNEGSTASFPAGTPNANGDIVGTSAAPVNAQLGSLANNGGQTDTRMLLLGSPAVNAGNNCVVTAVCPTANYFAPQTTDQRGPGLARQVGAAVDIGAFEQRVENITNTNDAGADSLRQVILDTPPGSIINFAYSASTPGCAGVVCTITLTSGTLAVDKSLTLNGPGARSLIIRRSTAAGTPSFRIFNITGDIAVNLSGLTIANGNGGIFVYNSLLNLNNVVIRDNIASAGAGILADDPSTRINIINSAIYNNTSQVSAFESEATFGTFGGGGIYNSGTLTVANSTISSNRSNVGGGIYNNGAATLNNVTISHNQASSGGGLGGGSGSVRNTIIAQNTATGSGASHDILGAFTSLGNNLVGNNNGGTGFTNGVNGDIVGTSAAPVNPRFGALQNNGGVIDTRALLPNSPAINKGNNCVRNLSCAADNPLVALTTDQRGATFPRMIGTAVDIGAFEMFSTRRAPFDFDGDNRTDIGVWRASSGSWWYLQSSNLTGHGHSFGLSNDIITPGDFTGDGKTDVAIWRPSTGEWFVRRSEDGSYFSYQFGLPGDIPAPADYDGDGITDTATFRPSTQTWYIFLTSTGGFGSLTFGLDGDKPVPADYDGDGKADIAVWRPSNGSWWIVYSSNLAQRGFGFGTGTDRPVVGDYTGDGKADIAVWRDATREWYFLRSEDGSYYSYPSGLPGDLPAPGEYDGDGKWDSAVFRPPTVTWYIDGSSAGSIFGTFGLNGDRPVANAFVP